jgi:hypothetical protein
VAATNRLRYNGLLCGTVPPTFAADISPSGTTITFPLPLKYQGTTAVPTIADPDYLPLVINPDTAAMEIVWLTAYTAGATSGTVLRAQEGTTGVAHSAGAPIAHGPTVADVAPAPPGDHYIRSQTSHAPVAVAAGAEAQLGVLLDTLEVPAGWASYDAAGGEVTLTEDGNYTIEIDAYATWATPPTTGFVDVLASSTYSLDPFMIGYASFDIAYAGYDPVTIKRSFYPAGTVIVVGFENNTDQAASVVSCRLYILRD